MTDLPIEKQLTHFCFCDAISEIKDIEMLKLEISKLHLLYLRQQVIVAQMAKDCLL